MYSLFCSLCRLYSPPASTARCPASPARCPASPARCPASPARCPASPARCPASCSQFRLASSLSSLLLPFQPPQLAVQLPALSSASPAHCPASCSLSSLPSSLSSRLLSIQPLLLDLQHLQLQLQPDLFCFTASVLCTVYSTPGRVQILFCSVSCFPCSLYSLSSPLLCPVSPAHWPPPAALIPASIQFTVLQPHLLTLKT